MDSQEQNSNPLGASENAHTFFEHMLFPVHTNFNNSGILNFLLSRESIMNRY